MISVPVYNQQGKKIDSMELSESVFKVAAKSGVVQQVVTSLLAGRRASSAHTKTRSEVRGGGKKPWKQKHTGRARHGSIRSPLWRGGGVTFGPRNTRNYVKKINDKVRAAALRMVLSEKVSQKKLIILDALTVTGKTKELASTLRALPASRSHLVVAAKSNPLLVRAAQNMPSVALTSPASLNAYDALTSDSLVMVREAVEHIAKKLTPRK